MSITEEQGTALIAAILWEKGSIGTLERALEAAELLDYAARLKRHDKSTFQETLDLLEEYK